VVCYRTSGRLRVRAGRKVKTGKTRKQELEQTGARGKLLVGFTKQNKLATDRDHRYKYTGDNREDWRHLEGGGDKHKDR
jgi:hypothetical protein